MTYLDKYRDKIENENGRMHVKMCDLDEDDLEMFYEWLFKKISSWAYIILMDPRNDANKSITYCSTSSVQITVSRIIIASFLGMPNLRSRVKDGWFEDRCFINFEDSNGDPIRMLPDWDDKNEIIRRVLRDEKTMEALKNRAMKIKGSW